MMKKEKLIRRLCSLTGIDDAYRDHRDEPRAIDISSLRALLAARGFDVDEEGALKEAIADLTNRSGMLRVPPVAVIRENQQRRVCIEVPLDALGTPLKWRMLNENGDVQNGECVPEQSIVREHDAHAVCGLELGPEAALGYHWLTISGPGDSADRRMRVIIAPATAYESETDQMSEWGVAVQLYALRSARNWGIGDFTDLAILGSMLGTQGADFLGINPLHALYPSNPEHASPYSPASRAFINYLYIDVEAVPDFESCEAARSKVSSEYFQDRLEALRACDYVDYSGVAFLKQIVLRHLYEHFVARELSRQTPRADAFLAFVEEGGAALEQVCLFYALYADNRKASREGGWQRWPEPLRDPESEAVASFAEQHQDTIRYYMYLQWLADEQLGKAHATALASGMKTGLYRDLAVGIDSNGADMWRNQALYCRGASVGAPPDAIALQGQDWGLPPMEPLRMQAEGYETFITDLRDNMRHCGALRLDHAMQLMRLWWTPAGRPSSDGAYVRYPLNDLLGIVALESHRNRCRIIGEDLGVVPGEIREALPREKIWSYKVILFEKDEQGRFRRPADYAPRAMATLTTHDLPTLPGYWRGADLLLREELGLFPSLEIKEQTWQERLADRRALIAALKRENLYPEGIPEDADQMDDLPAELLLAMERFLAQSTSRMVCVQLEDWMGVIDPVNVPGTSDEYPNWRRRLPDNIEDLKSSNTVDQHSAVLMRPAVPEQKEPAAERE